ncbi:MAG: PIN domain-containing protein [Coriobacteriia bacterium]|nr:PIN domain-containing protein [Coriobacteriia bacterium]
MLILTDTSFLIAAARQNESNHSRARAALVAHARDGLAVPAAILAETMGLLKSHWGLHVQRHFWDSLEASGITILGTDADLIANAHAIDLAYADAGFGFADCTLLATCEREGTARIMSFDRRLAAYKPTFAGSLELIP